MARTILLSFTIAGCLLVAAGCRCNSGLEDSREPSATSGQVKLVPSGPMRWCRACAMRGFTACKRVDGQEPEETLRVKARLAACKDVGLTEQECTDSVVSHVQCGLMPDQP